MAKRGAPSTYTAKIADEICAQLAGGKDLSTVCAGKGMPNPATIYRWLEKQPEFREKYARAREIQADVYAAQTVAIADRCREGRKTKRSTCTACQGKGTAPTSTDKPAVTPAPKCERCGGSGALEEITTADMVDRSRLMIDARKWYASKLAPKKYGEKLELAGDPDAPIKHTLDATPTIELLVSRINSIAARAATPPDPTRPDV